MKALVCIDLDRAIGFEGGLLFRLPEDLAFYKRSTLGKTVVMGRNTLLSMPRSKPLPGRNNLVLSASMEERDEELKGGFRFAVRNTPERALEYLRENGLFDEAVLSGGEAVYRLFLDECDELVVTQVMARAENADARFPEFRDSFHIVKELGPYFADGLMYYRRTYRKNG
ncbi:MAG: dihydrofolate reductase [Firmicutes bacterium]|nr:dihydrofolate reductase [Bacillota bacterium]